MPKIKANHINLYYEMYGQGDPIIFVAGFNTDHHGWDSIINDYAKSHQVIVFDNRGAGQSDCPDIPYTIEMMADDVTALCDALNLSSCHFIGASMGVGTILNLAYRYPDRCKSLVLSNGFIKIDPKFALFAQTRLELLRAGVDPKLVSKLSWSWVFSTAFLNQPGMLHDLQKNLDESPLSTSTVGYSHQLNALLFLDSSSWLKQIKVPTLVIGSDQDLIVSEKDIRAIADNIYQARYHCFKDVGHLPHVEATEQFNQVVKAFLAENK
jgi:3-oxoadipate enol-lactonase